VQRFKIILFITLHLLLVCQYQLSAAVNDTVNRKLSRSELNQLQESDNYKAIVNYKKKVKTDENWLKAWLFKSLAYLFGNRISLTFFNLLPYIIVIIAFTLIILKFSNIQLNSIFHRNPKELRQNKILEEPDNIEEFPIEKLLKQANQQQDYKLMIRYSYLLILKILHEKGLIDWQKYKSNYDYIFEMKSQNNADVFSSITRSYEYVWYGEFNINKLQGQAIYNKMAIYLKKLEENH